MSRFAPRIHVLLARDAPVGVVIRRGPSKQVATMLWDRRSDEFQMGQWLKGRIYERRSDLSPDGKFLIYFAMNGMWLTESTGSWTAVSRAPFLKAIAFFTKGDCWYGGGLWTGNDTYWINGGSGHEVSRVTSAVRRDKEYKASFNFGGECQGVYYNRLLRDGWKLVERINVGKWKDKDIFEKDIGKGWTLRKIAHAEVNSPAGKGTYWDEHELVRKAEDRTICFPTWEWAELDGERLVWAAEGKLFAAKLKEKGLAEEVELKDFNEMKFEPIDAPYER